MAEKCAAVIRDFEGVECRLPKPLYPPHLLWMCDQIIAHSDTWSVSHIHRWIGFIQAGMLANGMLDLQGLKLMFDDAKTAFGAVEDDPELLDHLNIESFFALDLGGQG
jgi:hypothetical protein